MSEFLFEQAILWFRNNRLKWEWIQLNFRGLRGN